MAMRLLVSICCIVTSSATSTTLAATTTTAPSASGVWSESQFKKEYDDYVLVKDASSVKTANANIVGALPPTQQKEIDMHRWYHDVNAAVQADAKAIMDKALVDKSAHGQSTADCLALIEVAMSRTDWATDNPIYLEIVGDDVLVAGPNKEAQDCVNALSGPEKELAIKVGMRSPLFRYFDDKWKAAVTAADEDVPGVSGLVTGTLGATVPVPADEKTGKFTQPMYSQADATLRGEMMIAMVNQLKAKLPVV